ncbi:MAG: Stp1/IreP family PP2C-type Ser/Thr phosphatase [Candidatus Sericytochromatia bacterium]|nr:Stp1/IreP family PP2C-type Ser/Thr phosphatase [Candidatus Tanganyikabacteria bacterium]
MRVGSLSDVGKVRSSNEDALGLDRDRGIFIVADGMGGHQAGEVASQQAVDSLLGSLRARQPEEGAAEAMVRAITSANSEIAAAAQADKNLKGMGTTVVAAIVEGDRFTIAHVGDSRAYLVRDGGIRQLTEDHSMVAELVKAGVITPEAAETHPYRSAISRSLGQFKEVETDTSVHDFLPGDRVLLCTDGLTRFVKAEEILERIEAHEDPQDASQALIDIANERGGRDNITVILIANA